ncbi:hypothetical protein [Aurantibacter sp.]|uniref:hypothetical protein n=1 Tax=Aurantibacter sp. TaxID=2807103 RepID=UPI0035C87537
MKTFALIFFTIILNACGSSKELASNTTSTEINSKTSKERNMQSEITRIEYIASTRGFYNSITVFHDSVVTQVTRNGKETSTFLSKEEWNEINTLVSQIEVTTIPTLEPPTQNYRTDVAAAAGLQIVIGDKSYQTLNFDNGNPPKEIKALVEKLIEFTKKKELNKNSKQSNVTRIEYVAISRGTYNRITVLPETVTTQMSRGEKEVSNPLSTEDWTEINTIVSKIEAASLPKLEAPSKKHQYDGAAGAYFQIAIGKKLYRTVTFDNGNPPKEIAEIVEKLFSFTKSSK